MGNKFEIHSWEIDPKHDLDGLYIPAYRYVRKWYGDRFFKAILMMWRLKKKGASYIKLEWRQ